MGFVVIILMLGGAFVCFAYVLNTTKGAWNRRMNHAATTYGLKTESGGWLRMGFIGLRGHVDDLWIEIGMPNTVPSRHDRRGGLLETMTSRSDEHAWHFTRGRVILPVASLGIEAGPESSTRIGRFVSGDDISIGDAPFDDVVRLAGPETELRATFDGPTRWAIRLLVERGGAFDGQRLELAWKHDDSVHRDQEMIDLLLDAGRALMNRARPARERLAIVAAEDEKDAVRAGALRCLVERHRRTAQTREALTRAADDAAPIVRIIPAVIDDDLPALEALLPPGVPEAVRLAAARQLGKSEGGRRILRQNLARLDGSTRSAAIEALRAEGELPTGGLALVTSEAGGLALTDPD